MATTAVFTEILVVGLQAAAWIALVVLAVFGTAWIDLGAIDEWATLVTVLVLATAYVLGIVVDRIADSVVRAAALRIQGPKPEPPGPASKSEPAGPGSKPEPARPGFQRMRLEVLNHGSDGVAKFLDYQRSRQRVARGTIVNVSCAVPALVAFLALRTEVSAAWLVGAVAAGLVAVTGAVYANERIYKAYTENLEQAYEVVRG